MGSTGRDTLHLHLGHGAKSVTTNGRNVGSAERVASVLGGSALTIYGLRRKDLIGTALALVGGFLLERGISGRSVAYDALGVSTAEGGLRLKKQHGPAAVLDASKARKIERSVTVDQPRAEIYRFWRNLENLPRIMSHLESVTVVSPQRSHWKAKAPVGNAVEWDAVIINEIENELIAWKSVDEADVPNAGSVHFKDAPAGRGTEVKVVLEYQPPAGALGARLAKFLGEEPDTQVREDLRRFKQMMEAGETPTIDGQPSGRA
jgi:uncharacterized membrane protein